MNTTDLTVVTNNITNMNFSQNIGYAFVNIQRTTENHKPFMQSGQTVGPPRPIL